MSGQDLRREAEVTEKRSERVVRDPAGNQHHQRLFPGCLGNERRQRAM